MATQEAAKKATSADAALASSWRHYPDLALPPILAAALEDFHKHGYHGSTVRGIATGVGLTMPSLYYHYGNKEGILFALLGFAMDDLLKHLAMCLEDAGDDTRVRFENCVTAIALHNTKRRDLSSLHDEFRFLGPDLRPQYVAKRSIVRETLIGLLKDGIEEGIFLDEDPYFTSRVLLGTLSGILDWYRPSGPLSANDIAARYARDALRVVSHGEST
ncbi:TetR/AcrR family transcriptional regulator (plasmid) [Arthrobacter sp. Z1-9]